MGFIYPFVVGLSSLFLFSSHAANVEDVIHLDLSPLRVLKGEADGGTPPSVQVSSKSQFTIYCSPSTFPSDIFCDLSSLERMDYFSPQPVTTKFYLKYAHPTRSQSECFVAFENDDEKTPSELSFKSFSCYDSNSTVEWLSNVEWRLKHGGEASAALPPQSPLPETLRVGDVAVVEIEDRGTENPSLKCRRRFRKVAVPPPPLGGSPSPVAFGRDFAECISTAPPPEPTNLPEFHPPKGAAPEA